MIINFDTYRPHNGYTAYVLQNPKFLTSHSQMLYNLMFENDFSIKSEVDVSLAAIRGNPIDTEIEACPYVQMIF